MEVVQPGGGTGGGSLTVTDGITPVVNVTTVNFTTGATVTNGGGGTANVSIAGSGGGMAIGGAVTSGTTGSVLFVGAGPVLAQDNANYFWDAANSNLRIGATSASITSENKLSVIGNANDYHGTFTQNKSAATGASTDIVAGNDLSVSDSTTYVDFGLNSSTNVAAAYTGFSAGGAYLYTSGQVTELTLATGSASKPIKFLTGGTLAANERVRILGTGEVGIGTTTPYARLSVQSDGLGVTQLDYAGIILRNSTAAAVNAQQVSPPIVWEAQGWKTNATAASQTVRMQEYVLPVQAAANPTATWTLASSINGAAYTTAASITSASVLTVNNIVMNGSFQTATSNANSNLWVTGASGTTNQTATPYIFGTATTVALRTVFYGVSSNTLTAGSSYAGVVIARTPTTTAATGTHPWLTSIAVLPVTPVTAGASTIANTASLYVEGSATATVTGKNYAFYVNSGVSRVSALEMGRTTVADVNYTVLATDYLVAYTTLTATRTVTLPAAGTVTNQYFLIKDEVGTAGANNIVISGTIDGAASKTITTNYGFLMIYSNGTAYFTGS